MRHPSRFTTAAIRSTSTATTAGILIVSDRLFGSLQEQLHRPTYGLTTPVGTYNLIRLATHEYAAIARDVRDAPTWREKLGYVFGPPGWRPSAAELAAVEAGQVPQ